MGPAPREGSGRRKSFCTLRNPFSGRDGGAPESQRGMQRQVLRRQNRETPSQRSFPTSTSHLRSSLHTCPATEVCVLKLRLWRLDPREKTGVDCCEDTLRGLVQHSQGSPGKRAWACQRGKRSLSWDPLTPRTL